MILLAQIVNNGVMDDIGQDAPQFSKLVRDKLILVGLVAVGQVSVQMA